MDTSPLEKIRELLEKLAAEAVMAEVGSDSGMLPILDLLGNLRDFSESDKKRAHFHNCARDAAVKMISVVEAGKPFSKEDIDWLNQLLPQLEKLLKDPKLAYSASAKKTPQEMMPLPPEEPKPAKKAASLPAPTPAPPPVIVPVAEEEIPLVMNLESDAELLKEFINESQEHLDNIEQGVLVLEENPTDAATLNSIFRAFHTFKGGSGFLNLVPINRLAHELESLLDMARQHKLTITSDVINLILQGGDTLKQFVAEMTPQIGGQKPSAPILIPTSGLKVRARAVIQGTPLPPQAAAPKPAPAAVPTPAPAATPAAAPAPASAPAATSPEEKPAPAPSPEGAAPAADKSSARLTGVASVVKVDTMKLDSVVDMVGELVIAESLVMQDPDLKKLDSRQLTRNLAQLRRITNELQRMTMAMRMVPIRAAFQKMTRVVRDLAAKLGKQVQLTLVGEETELDRTVVEEISDPLLHMVRNAVDHGLEMPDKRQADGKPVQGSVQLRAFHQGGNIVIEIKDDGAGLNKDRIRAKGIEKGIISSDEQLTDHEIYGLIFAPGFSTAEKVTEISGRGVGMDVVLRNIEKLRGKVEIESAMGQGSTFSIYLPLTLAIIEGLIVSVGDHRYIIPTLSIRESFRPSAGMISTVHERGEMVNVRGKLIPLLRLYEHFNIKPQSADPTQAIVVVVEAGRDSRCVLVDQLLGKQEVVIKSLGETFKGNRSMAGAAILGDGRVGLILDASTLVKLKAESAHKAA